MKKNFLIKKLYQLILFSCLLLAPTIYTHAYTDSIGSLCEDIFNPSHPTYGGKYLLAIPNSDGTVNTSSVIQTYSNQDDCRRNLKDVACGIAFKQRASCDPAEAYRAGLGGAWPSSQGPLACVSRTYTVDSSNIDILKGTYYAAWGQKFLTLLGNDWESNWDTADPTKNKTRMYGVWTCGAAGPSIPKLIPPITAPSPVTCAFQSYDVFATSIGTGTCSGSTVCERDNVIRDGAGTRADKKFYCINDQIIMCPNTVTTYSQAKTSSECVRFNNLTAGGTYPSFSITAKIPVDLSPAGLIKTISNFLFYFAILYFVLLILSNGYAYVRAGEDPNKLKEIKASLFNTIAGFLFVLLSGGLIISLINQLKI